jgi:hypothetical protein
MVILARQVLFFENACDDPEVVTGIRAQRAGQDGTATGSPAQAVFSSAVALTWTARPAGSH